MDVLIGWKGVEYEFGGNKVSVEIRQLKVPDMVALLPCMMDSPPIKKKPSPDDLRRAAEYSLKIQEVASGFLSDSVRNITGLTINGKPIKSATVLCEEVIFSNLVVEIVGDLIKISTLTKEKTVNLDEPVTS